jgi:hypothetical protein
VGLEDVEDHVLLALAGHALANAERFGEFQELDGVLALQLGQVDQAIVAAGVGVLVVVDGITGVVARLLVVAAAIATAAAATLALLVTLVTAAPASAFALVAVVAVLLVLAATLRLALRRALLRVAFARLALRLLRLGEGRKRGRIAV